MTHRIEIVINATSNASATMNDAAKAIGKLPVSMGSVDKALSGFVSGLKSVDNVVKAVTTPIDRATTSIHKLALAFEAPARAIRGIKDTFSQVGNAITAPFRFASSVVTAPFKLITDTVGGAFRLITGHTDSA